MNGSERSEWIRQLSVHLADRAEEAPWLTAVRLGDTSVTYGDLAESLHGYRRVVDVEFMSVESALTAAVIHNIPSLAERSPAELSAVMGQIIKWLGRDMPAVQSSLRAVV